MLLFKQCSAPKEQKVFEISKKRITMRSLVTALVFFLTIQVANAQWSYKFRWRQKHYLYTTGDYVVGKNNAADLSLNYVYNKSISLKVGYSASSPEQSRLPTDYLKSTSNLAPTDINGPFENMESYHLLVGKVFNIGSAEKVRVVLQAGPGLSTQRTPVFWKRADATAFETNYDYTIHKKQMLGLVVNPKVEFPFSNMFGFSIGPMFIMNKETKYLGAAVGFMYGIIGNDKS